MGRYLHLLAIAVVIIEVCTPLLTALLTISPPIWFVTVAGVGFLVLQALIITGTLLTIVMSTLALVSAFQRNQRPWFLSFLALALLSVYSPLLLIWMRISRTPFSDFYSLPTHRAAYYLIQLIPDIFPVFLAVVVFIYSLRYGRNESQHSGFSVADRAQLD